MVLCRAAGAHGAGAAGGGVELRGRWVAGAPAAASRAVACWAGAGAGAEVGVGSALLPSACSVPSCSPIVCCSSSAAASSSSSSPSSEQPMPAHVRSQPRHTRLCRQAPHADSIRKRHAPGRYQYLQGVRRGHAANQPHMCTPLHVSDGFMHACAPEGCRKPI
jgi:hypothetical protein